MSEIDNIVISFGDISDEIVRGVAERCNTTEVRVHAYLSTNEQDDALLRAFLFFGIGPLRKAFRTNDDLHPIYDISMGCVVPHKR